MIIYFALQVSNPAKIPTKIELVHKPKVNKKLKAILFNTKTKPLNFRHFI